MNSMKQIAKNFIEMCGNEDAFIEASSAQAEMLTDLIGEECSAVIEFFTKFQPNNLPMTESYVSLLNIEKIIAENAVEPGEFLAEYGVYVIAVTAGGNAVCVDTNNMTDGDPSVLIADSGFCAYNDSLGCVEITVAPDEVLDELDDDEILPLNYENIVRCLPQIEESFTEFMSKLSVNEYDDIEEYLDMD